MEFRPGLCSACKASFRIPATFTANKAKCSKCGGTVDIGAVTTDSASPAKPAPSAPPVPAKAISAGVAAAAARLASKPEDAPDPAKVAKARPPLAAPKAATPAARPAAAKAAAAPRTAVKPAGVKAKTKAAAEADHDEGDEVDERTARRQRLEKKKGMSPALLALSAVAVIGVSVGVWFAVQKYKEEDAAKQAAALVAENARKEQLVAEAAAKAAAMEAAEAQAEQRAEEAKLAAEAKAAEKAANPVASKPAADKGPVEGFDLSTIADFGPTEDTTPEEWVELQELAALFIDFSAGARSARAGTKMMETPKKAFPAILNQFKKLNLEDEEGYRMADATQKLLERICKGHNVGWRYEQQENWLQYNQKAIKKWCDVWTRASTDEVFWNSLVKNEASKPAEGSDTPADAPPPKKLDDY
jgi:hypothetical protein